MLRRCWIPHSVSSLALLTFSSRLRKLESIPSKRESSFGCQSCLVSTNSHPYKIFGSTLECKAASMAIAGSLSKAMATMVPFHTNTPLDWICLMRRCIRISGSSGTPRQMWASTHDDDDEAVKSAWHKLRWSSNPLHRNSVLPFPNRTFALRLADAVTTARPFFSKLALLLPLILLSS